MNDELMTKLNIVLYYVICPLLIIEFLLSDMHIVSFMGILIIITSVVILALLIVSVIYNRNHPDYHYVVNNIYSKVLVCAILLEVFLGK